MTACGARCFSCYCVIMHLDFVVAVCRRDLSRLEPAAFPSTSSSEDRVLPAIDNSIGEAWLEHLNVLAVRAASFCSDSS